MLFVFTAGKKFQGGNNDPLSVISSLYTMDSTNILFGGPSDPNAYWAVTVFHFVS